MKKILSLCLLMAASCMAYAQIDSLKAATGKEKAEVIARRMERELSLNKKQTQKVIQIVQDRFVSLEAKATYSDDFLETVNAQARKKLADILTKEQYTLYTTLRDESVKHKQDNSQKRSAGYTPSREDKELDF